MATIAKLVIQGIFDPSEIRKGVREAAAIIKGSTLTDILEKRLNKKFPQFELAKQMQESLAIFKQDLANTKLDLSAKLAEGLINPQEFKSRMVAAERIFNTSMAALVRDAQRTGLAVSGQVSGALAKEFKFSGVIAEQAANVRAQMLLKNATTGRALATSILTGMKAGFAANISDARDQLSQGLISVHKFQNLAEQAALAFNTQLSAKLRELRGAGSLTADLETELVRHFKVTGEESSRQFFSAFRRSLSALSQVGQTLTVALTLPIAAVGAASVKLSGDFEHSMNRVQALTQATVGQFEALRAQARKLGAETQFTATDAADAMQILSQQALKARAIFAVMPSVLQLAAAAQLSMADAAGITTGIMASYNLTAEDMGKTNDILVKATTQARVDLRELGTAFKIVGPIAQQAGLSFEEVTSALALLGRANITGDRAGTALRGAISRLLTPTKNAAEEIKRLAGNVETSTGKLLPLAVIMDRLKKSGADVSDVLTIFGDRAGPAMAALLAQGGTALQALASGFKADGTAARIAAAEMKGLTGGFRELRSASEEFALRLGDAGLLGGLDRMVRKLADMIRSVDKSDDGLFRFAITFGSILAVIGPTIFAVTKFATAVWALNAALTVMVGRAALAGLASLLLPGGVIILGLTAIVAAMYSMGAATRNAARAVEEFKAAAAVMTDAQLRSSLFNVSEQIDALNRQREVLSKAVIFNAGGKRILDPNAQAQITAIDKSIAALTTQSKILGKVFDENKQRQNDLIAEQRAAAAAIEASELAAIGNTKVQTEGIDKVVKALRKQVDAIITIDKLSRKNVSRNQDLGTAGTAIVGTNQRILDLWERVNKLLKEQGDLHNANTAALEKMRAALRATVAVQELLQPTVKNVQVRDITKSIDTDPRRRLATVSEVILRQLQTEVDKYIAIKNQVSLALITGNKDLARSLGANVKDQESLIRDVLNGMRITAESLKLPPKQIQDLLEGMTDSLHKAGIEAEGLFKRSDVTRITRALTTVLRGVFNIGSAFKFLSDSAKDAIRSIADAAEAVTELKAAQSSGDLLGSISSTAGAIASAISAIVSVVGTFHAGEHELKEVLNKNNQELEKVRDALSGFRVTVGSQANALSILQADKFIAFSKKIESGTFQKFRDQLHAFEVGVAGLGISFSQLKAIADANNIQLISDKGQIVVKAFDQLVAIIQANLVQLTRFSDSLSDQITKQDLFNKVNQITKTPQRMLDDALGLLKFESPDIFGKFFGGVDLKSIGDVQKAVRAMVDALLAGSIEASAFGKLLSKDELIEIINRLQDGLDGFGKALDSATQKLLNVPDGLRVDLLRFNATTPFTGPVPSSGSGSASSISFSGDIVIQGRDKDAPQLADEIIGELQQRARARFGDSRKWPQVN